MSATRERPRRKLPTGIQNLREIREDDCYYVDKTAFIRRLVDEGKHYFLSRPRRFGKSLFLDTLKELFEGNEALFVGLDAHDGWDWSVRHPVLRLDFSSGHFAEPGYLHTNLMTQLAAIEELAAIEPPTGVGSHDATAPERFRHLIAALRERAGQRVVVLVDEYDKPILDALEKPEVARANRDYLHGLYSTIKFADAHVKFTLLTGVSKFSKVSLFSGLNNLVDITLEPEYSTICGYTDADLDTVFAPELPGLDRDRIREWYNGYAWLGEERVYNPFDVLLLFRRRRFGAWWFETGTPTFLVNTLLARGVGSTELDGMRAGDELLSAFDVDDIGPEALLFQTGYLTILDAEDVDGELLYRLGYPNREVRQSLNRSLLSALVPAASRRLAQGDRLPPEARLFLDRDDDTGQVRRAPAYRDIFQKALYGTSTDPLSILCEDAVAEGVIRGVLDVLNVELELQHGDVVIGRNSGRDEFPGHVRTLAKFGRLSNFILVLDGDSRELQERLETVAERQGHAAHVLFLPGDGPPEQWLWDTVRERPDAYAERLGITATDMQRSMRHLEGLVDGAVQRRQDMAKVAVNALAHRVERTVAEFARIVGRHEARTEALFELVDGLKKLIEQWRRL